MKKITTLVLLLMAAIGYSQNAPIDFEAGGNGATWTWTVFENSTNPPLEIIANPDPTGANTSATVAKFTALQAGMPFAGVESMHGADIGTFTLDATNSTIKIMVWKPVASNVGIKLVTNPGASTGEILVPNTLINQWEELTFDFSGLIGNPATIDIDQIVIFPDFDARTQDNIVYFDNVTFGPELPSGLPLDFEGTPPTFNDFNGSFTQVIANPAPGGVNNSANVAENTVPANAAFAGVNIPVPVDITTDKLFRMDVWSPLANTPVLLKLEGGPNPPIEREVNLTTNGAWEEIVFDFSSEGALTYDSVTVFMNFNMVDPNTQTYYWDNLELYSAGPPALALPLTFEGQTVTFNDFNGSFTQVIANPDPTGVNTSANVAENTVPANAAFAGVNIVVPVDITTDKFFRMDVWSPLAGTPVLLKLEGGPNPPIERMVNLTTTSAWEEIVFDFSSEGALTYDSVTVFMNFNMVDPNTQTYYWDNLELYSPGLALPLTFEGQTVTFNDFNGSFTQVIANPDPTGVNTSANVAENTVPANAAFAGVNIVVPVDITTDKFFRMDVWSPLANTPVLLKLEGGPNPPIERLVNSTTNGAWEEVVFDFSSEGALTYDSVTVFMNFNMVDPNTQTYYWDNLELYSPPPPPLALPITFEMQMVTFNDFNGSFTQAIANPDPTGVNTSATVAENTVPANAAFAGVNIAVPVDISVDKGFTMDVWSPLANTPVLLKLENSVTGVNVEREESLTTTSAWEKLTFDFSSEGALTFDSVTIFMNFNMMDPNTQVYYWDNLEQINLIAGPANDLCENAISITCGEIVSGTTIDATIDDSVAPLCDTSVTAPGVWYVYEDTTGLVTDITITMCNGTTDYDSKLSVYTGDCGAPPLTCVVGNDDTCGLQSEVQFQSDGATTFYILVHGFGSNVGNFEIEMTCTLVPPPNDMIANSIDVDEIGLPYTDPAVAMPAATTEAGTPAGCDNAGVKGVWYNFVSEGDGTATASITTPSPASVLFSVNNGPLAGNYSAVAAGFGGEFTTTPITQDTAVVIDDDSGGTSTDPNDACDPIINGASLAGKIAIVRRGACEFGGKVLAAENEGAIAVIVVNNVPGPPIVMGGGASGGSVTIPALMVEDVDGEAIIAEVLGGGTVNATMVLQPAGFSSVTFYTAPNEMAVETDLTLVPWVFNQCVPGIEASINTVAGQAYYVYVANHGSITDIVIDGTNLGVTDNTIEGISYYPNPTENTLYLNAVDKIESVTIHNIIGQVVINKNVNSTTSEINVSSLAAGAYIMKVRANGQVGTYKIIKQ